jgi:hypothetical protein
MIPESGTSNGFIPPIVVNCVTVTDPNDATVNITIPMNAKLVSYDMKLTLGSFNVFANKVLTVQNPWILTPNTGNPGQTLSVAIAGPGLPNGMSLNFGGGNAGVTVNFVTVTDSNDATVNITIDPSVPAPVFLNVTLTVPSSAGFNTFTIPNAFEVTPPPGP